MTGIQCYLVAMEKPWPKTMPVTRPIRGFTLVELMIALAIMGIAAAMAMPLINNLVRNARLTSTANDIVEAIAVARAEAVRQGRDVEIVPIGGGAWRDGWQIQDVATQTVIKQFDPLSDTLDIGTDVAITRVAFAPTGARVAGEVAVVLTLCLSTELGGEKGRRVSLNRAGSTTIEQIESGCSL